MIILEIIGAILVIPFFLGLLSTILGQPLKYRRDEKPFVEPDTLPSILMLLLNFLKSLPNQIFNSKKYKLNKLLSKRQEILEEIKTYEQQILICEIKINNENKERNKIKKLREDLKNDLELNSFEKMKKESEINRIELSNINLFSNYEVYQKYNDNRRSLENARTELIAINKKLDL